MIPSDEQHPEWIYADNAPTVPTARSGEHNEISSAFPPQTPFEARDQEDFFSPFSQKSNKPKRRGMRLLLIFVLIILLALGTGFTANAFGALPLLHQLTQSGTFTPPQGNKKPGTAQPGGEKTPTQTPQLPQTLPAEWTASGHTVADAADASVIAQGFTERYDSIDGSTQQSLAASLVIAQEVFMTPNGQLRYQGKVAGTAPDPHFTKQFASQFQMGATNQILSQQAITDGPPQMLPPQQVNGTFFALITVPYQKTVTFQSGRVQVTEEHMTVALVAVPKNGHSVPNIMGWKVTAYAPGTTPPPLPMQP